MHSEMRTSPATGIQTPVCPTHCLVPITTTINL